jgi:hypothetical protein
MGSPRERNGVFISYRREETAPYAGRLYDRLSDHFGEDRVFMDVDSIGVGVDFTRAVVEAIAGCNILLALIGRRWIAVADARGKRRIDNLDDYVRLEIETALQRDIWVVPVLVDGAALPQADDLPPSLRPLVRHQAIELSHTGFRSEITRLIAAVADALEAGSGRSAAPKASSRGAVGQQTGWQLMLLEDKVFTKTFRLSSGVETHHIIIKFGTIRGTVEVDGQIEVSEVSHTPMQIVRLKALSATLGCNVTIQYETTWDKKTNTAQRYAGEARLPYLKRALGPTFNDTFKRRPAVNLLILTIGDQVVRYQSGSR